MIFDSEKDTTRSILQEGLNIFPFFFEKLKLRSEDHANFPNQNSLKLTTCYRFISTLEYWNNIKSFIELKKTVPILSSYRGTRKNASQIKQVEIMFILDDIK